MGQYDKRRINQSNVNLLKAPEDVVDYIILHELCHLKVKEHSHHYWDYVRRYIPNYQKKIEVDIISIDQIKRLLYEGKILNAASIAAFYKALDFHERYII